MICPKCNSENASGSICCSKCGNFLPKEQVEQNTAPVQEEVAPQEPVETKQEEITTQEDTTTETQEKETVTEEPVAEQTEPVVEDATPVVEPQEETTATEPIQQVAESVQTVPTTQEPVAPVVNPTPTIAPQTQPAQSKGKTGVIIVIVIVVALLGLGGYLVYDHFNKGDNNKSNETTTKTTENNNNNNSNSNNNNNTSSDEFKSYDNYRVEVKMTASVSGVDMEVLTKGVVDEVNQVDHMVMTTKTMGISLDTEMYYDFKNGYTYTSIFGSWTKQKEASHVVDLAMFLKELKDGKNATKIDDNHYKLKLSTKDVEGVLDESTSVLIDTNGEVEADIYIEDGYITKIDYDFSKLFEGMDYTTTVKLYDYNKAGTVEIPDSVKDSDEDDNIL